MDHLTDHMMYTEKRMRLQRSQSRLTAFFLEPGSSLISAHNLLLTHAANSPSLSFS